MAGDEEHYEGIDDANRRYAVVGRRSASKRWATSDDASRSARTQCRFPQHHSPYVESAASHVADKLLPTDDRSWLIKPTPITREMRRVFAAQGVDEAAIEEAREESKEKAGAMQDEIDDCLVESQWHGEMRAKVIEDASRIGTGVLKGPLPCPPHSAGALAP